MSRTEQHEDNTAHQATTAATAEATTALPRPSDAAQWFARMQSGEASPDEIAACAAWRAADPAHERDYRNLSFLWSATQAVPEARLRALMQASPTAYVPRPVPARRQFNLRLVGAGAFAAVAGVAGASLWLTPPSYAAEVATRRGERRQLTLPDGSVLDLNTDTRVLVRYSDDERAVVLAQGEAFFDVRREPNRPFRVDAGAGEVLVTGTRFNVLRTLETAQISVASGSVLVRSGRWWQHQEQQLTAGQQTTTVAGQAASAVTAVNISAVATWQRGKVLFNNQPLASVIDDMNRYLPQPTRLDAPELREHRVSGVFSVDDPQAMLDALPAIAPVLVMRLPDGRSRIVAR